MSDAALILSVLFASIVMGVLIALVKEALDATEE